MKNRMLRRFFFVVAISGMPALSMAQEVSPAEVGNRALNQVPNRTMDQLSDLVAPIALYPDALLSQVLVASTYPLEVVQAQQWLQRNQLLQGQKLMDAARQQPWDASVQGLVAFPDALSTLNEDVQWTTELGNAFLAQESDVMVAVQGLRTQAQTAGRLASNEQQTVSAVAEEGRTVIEIVPADPEVIYVPRYDPYYVWGSPAWGAYPSLAYGYGYGYGPGVNVGFWFGGWSWGLGWGWGPNWYGGSVYVNSAFFRHCGYNYGHHGSYYGGHNGGHNGGRYGGRQAGGHAGRENWQHDGGHRKGVPYADGRRGGQSRGGSQATRSGSQGASSAGRRAMASGSRGGGTDQGWRTGNRTEVSGPRRGGTEQGRQTVNRTEVSGSRRAGTDQGWRTGNRAENPGSRSAAPSQGLRAGNRTTGSSPRSGGADRGWSSTGEQRRGRQGLSQGERPAARYSAPSPRSSDLSPRYSASSPRSSASSPGHSAPSRSYSAPPRSSSSSAPSRSFQTAPRMSTSGGSGRNSGGGMSQRSGGSGSSRGSAGGRSSGGSSSGGGRRH